MTIPWNILFHKKVKKHAESSCGFALFWYNMPMTETLLSKKQRAARLDFQIDEFNNGGSASWKINFDVFQAQQELKNLNEEIEELEELERIDEENYKAEVALSNN